MITLPPIRALAMPPSIRALATMAALAVALSACGLAPSYRASNAVMLTQAIDPARYAGEWHEIARFPVFFQRGCTESRARYTVEGPARLGVVNTCWQDGEIAKVAGQATVVGPGKLRVRFGSVPFVAAPYWVLWVDDDYQTAVIGVPSHRAGWILARDAEISDTTRDRAEAVLRANGYDTSALIFDPQ